MYELRFYCVCKRFTTELVFNQNFTMLGLILAVLTAIPIVLYLIGKKWEENFNKCNIPGPKGVLLLGNLPEFYAANKARKCMNFL